MLGEIDYWLKYYGETLWSKKLLFINYIFQFNFNLNV